MISQLASPGFEEDARLIREQSRQRVLAAARRLEHVAAVDFAALQIACLAGYAEFEFGAVVEWLQIGIRQRPVCD